MGKSYLFRFVFFVSLEKSAKLLKYVFLYKIFRAVNGNSDSGLLQVSINDTENKHQSPLLRDGTSAEGELIIFLSIIMGYCKSS